MELMQLPDELLVLIFSRLDFVSKMHVYSTCNRLANIICCTAAVGRTVLTQHIVDLIQQAPFRALAPYIEHLDLSLATSSVRNRWLVPVVEEMQRLRTLNIATDKVMYPEGIIKKAFAKCSHLTNLTVNIPIHGGYFWFILHLTENCPTIETFHCVGKFSEIFNIDLIENLRSCKALKELKLTAIQNDMVWRGGGGSRTPDRPFNPNTIFPFQSFVAHLSDCLLFFKPINFDNDDLDDYDVDVSKLLMIEKLIKHKWDYLIIKNLWRNIKIYMSPKFYFHGVHFIERCILHESQPLMMNGNHYHVFMWDPKLADCNVNFHMNVLSILNTKIPKHICKNNLTSGCKPVKRDSYFINPCALRMYWSSMYRAEYEDDDDDVPKKICKTSSRVCELNLNHHIDFGDSLKLTLGQLCSECKPAPALLVLDSRSSLLRDVTYVCFSIEINDWLHPKFLIDLLRECKRLDTLNYECDATLVVGAIGHSTSLKNLRVFNLIGGTLVRLLQAIARSSCPFENIHICETSSESFFIRTSGNAIREIIKRSPNLYSFEFHGPWSKYAKLKTLQAIRPTFEKRDVRCELVRFDESYFYHRDANPFYGVFLGSCNLFDVNFKVIFYKT